MLSLNSNFSFNISTPHVFITWGFLHSNFFHILFNMIILGLYYPLISRNENKDIWKVYIVSILMGSFLWLFYLNFYLYTPSVLLGASGGIMGLISYSCNKWFDEVALDLGFIKIKFAYFLYTHMILIILNFLNHQNDGGEIAHLSGILVGWYYSRK